MTTIDERIAAILQPLRDELTEIDRQIVAARADLVELFISRKRVAEILKRADGKPSRPKPKADQPVAQRHVDYVRDFIQRSTASQRVVIKPLAAQIVEHAKATGVPVYPGHESVRRAVHVLHESGELRLVGKGRGGSNIYAYIGGSNGA